MGTESGGTLESAALQVVETTPNAISLIVGHGPLETLGAHRAGLTDGFCHVFSHLPFSPGFAGGRREKYRAVTSFTRGDVQPILEGSGMDVRCEVHPLDAKTAMRPLSDQSVTPVKTTAAQDSLSGLGFR